MIHKANNSEFDIAPIDKLILSGALRCAQEIKYLSKFSLKECPSSYIRWKK